MEFFENKNNQQRVDWEEKFKKSGMTIDEWNKSILKERDVEIAKQVEKARQERIYVEQKTNFMVNEIKHKGNAEAARIIAEAKIDGQKFMMDAMQYKTDYQSGKETSNYGSINSTNDADIEEKKYNRFIIERDKQRQQDQLQRQSKIEQQQQDDIKGYRI